MNAPRVPLTAEQLPAYRNAIMRGHMQALTRALFALGYTHRIDRSITASDFARKAWPDERGDDIERVIRAAVSPSDTTSGLMGYSQVLLKALVPVAAAPALIDHVAGLPLSWPVGTGHLLIPAVNMTGLAKFIGEAGPIPVTQGVASNLSLSPLKLAEINVLSGEIFRYTPTEPMVEKAIGESIGSSLDVLMFNANAGTAITPPGLMFNVAPLNATALTGESFVNAMLQDLAILTAAVSGVAGNDADEICIIASAKQAAMIRWFQPNTPYPVFKAWGLPDKTVIAVAARALAFVARDPRFDLKDTPTLHMEDTAPQPIGSVGTPAVVAAPTRSLWQTDTVGVRFIWPLNWGLRSPQGIAWMDAVNW